MSDNKNFFKVNSDPDHSRSDAVQGSSAPYTEEPVKPASFGGGFSEKNIPPSYDVPNQGYTENFNTSYYEVGDHSRPPISNVMSSESGANSYGNMYSSNVPPPPAPKKSGTGILIAVIVAAVILVGCLGVFGYFVISDRQAIAAQEEAEMAEVQNVRDLIAAIGAVSLGSGDAIANARLAYDALSTDQKDLVSNYSTLTTAEQHYHQLLEEQAEKEAEEARKKAEEKAVKSTLVVPDYTSYYGDFTVNANSGLVLRYGPSTSYYKIVTMPYGSWVEVYAWSGEWAYVSYGNRQGWCNGKYLW